MGAWIEAVEAKANIIHGQILAVRELAARLGEDANPLCQVYFDLLRNLYEDEFPFAKTVDESDLVARFQGPVVDTDTPPVSIVTNVFSNLRNQVRGIAKAIVGLDDNARLNWPNELDPYLSGLAKGSLIVGIKVPSPSIKTGQLALPHVSDQVFQSVRDAVRSLAIVTRHIDEAHVDEGIREEIPDPAVRDAVMVAARRLAPTGRKGIDKVSLYGQDKYSGEAKPLTPRSRTILTQSLTRPIKLAGRGTFVGVVREVDLDVSRFEIRGVKDIGAIRCIYEGSLNNIVRDVLDRRISVTGSYETLPNDKPRLIAVDSIKILSSNDEQLDLDINQ